MAQPLEALRRLCRSLQSAEAVGEQALMQSENCQTLVCLLNLVGTFLEALSASATQSPSLSTSLRGQSLSQQLQALEASVREATALLRRCTLAKSRVYLVSTTSPRCQAKTSAQIPYCVSCLLPP